LADRRRPPHDSLGRARGLVDGRHEHAVIDRAALRGAWMRHRRRDLRPCHLLPDRGADLGAALRVPLILPAAAKEDGMESTVVASAAATSLPVYARWGRRVWDSTLIAIFNFVLQFLVDILVVMSSSYL